MEKLMRDFSMLLTIGFGGLLMKEALAFDNAVVVVGASALFALISEVVRSLVEVDIENGLLDENVVLVVRDSAIAFTLSYAFMTAAFGVVTFAAATPYVIAALAPTMIVTAISKESRIPSTNMLIVGKKAVVKESLAA